MTNASKIAPTTVPKTIIAAASVNFAFLLPANALPASQRDGDKNITLTIILIIKTNKLKTKVKSRKRSIEINLYNFWKEHMCVFNNLD